MPGQIPQRERSNLDQPTRAQVLPDQEKAQAGVRGRKTGGRTAVERVLGVGRHHRDDEHLDECQHPLYRIVRVEPGREGGVADPCPPDERKERRESNQTDDRVVLSERLRDLTNGRDEDQIEEQLEPRHLATDVVAN